MANMSYCMFQNTSNDLRDCVDALAEAYDVEELDLSNDEMSAMKYMRDLCEQFLAESERILSTESVDFED